MGFMNKISKMKNFLFDEEEVEEKPLKKHIIKEKKVSAKKLEDDLEKTQEIENLYMEDFNEDIAINNEVKSRTVKSEPSFEFPSFNDDDFAEVSIKKEPIISTVKEEVKPILYQGSKRKDDTKKFKPSPIISPVYGLLDDKGKEIKKDSDFNDLKNKSKEDITFDEVRRKAYGESIEDTLKISDKTIAEAEKLFKEKEEGLSREKQKVKKEEKFKTISDLKKEDDMILPNVNFKEIDVDKERLENTSIISKKRIDIDDDDDEETKEQDLFNLIDSMYQGKESEE